MIFLISSQLALGWISSPTIALWPSPPTRRFRKNYDLSDKVWTRMIWIYHCKLLCSLYTMMFLYTPCPHFIIGKKKICSKNFKHRFASMIKMKCLIFSFQWYPYMCYVMSGRPWKSSLKFLVKNFDKCFKGLSDIKEQNQLQIWNQQVKHY